MHTQRKPMLYTLAALVLFRWVASQVGWDRSNTLLSTWLVLMLAWVIAFAFTTKTGAPLPRYVRNTMIGILAAGALTMGTIAGLLHGGHSDVTVEQHDIPTRSTQR